MKRTELLQQMRVATTPNDISTALSDARAWLRVHPRDHEVAFSMLDLLSVERHALGSASSGKESSPSYLAPLVH
jgi:hypothetical protein